MACYTTHVNPDIAGFDRSLEFEPLPVVGQHRSEGNAGRKAVPDIAVFAVGEVGALRFGILIVDMPAQAGHVVDFAHVDGEVAAVAPRIGSAACIPAVAVELAVEHGRLLRGGVAVPNTGGAARRSTLTAGDRPCRGRSDLRAVERRRADFDIHRDLRNEDIMYGALLDGISGIRNRTDHHRNQIIPLFD